MKTNGVRAMKIKTKQKERTAKKSFCVYEAKRGPRRITIDEEGEIEKGYIDIIKRRKKAFDQLADD